MHISTDPFPSSRPPTVVPGTRLGGDAVPECDWCGRAVRRETGYERVEHGDDGVEVVLLCPDCELGTE
jgi:hypothetical protein